jgi:putative colanic acid biosynthesis UDP-glucose lipid carrier transferase
VNAARPILKNVVAPSHPDAPDQGAPRIQFGDTPSVALLLLERLDLLVVVLTLFGSLMAFQEEPTWDYAGLAVVAVILCGRFITAPDLRAAALFGSRSAIAMPRLLVEWGSVVGMLLLAGFALKVSDSFSRATLLTWFAVTPVALVAVQEFQGLVARRLSRTGHFASRFVIVGVNKLGVELARRMPDRGFLGFFDFRSVDRLATSGINARLAGHCAELGKFVREHGVASVYIALPIANAPRIRDLLADLQNSTASVYFVPDVFAFDLIQAKVVDVNGVPALAVCDTPMRGTNVFVKRAMDLGLTLVGVLALLPVFAAIAIAIRIDSRGPVFFRQRRYGMDGREIIVYKFRSMTVCEDGGQIRQASPGDARITKVGRFLRRTSLDELPQLFNVLEGTMSLVGPRPHAVAHNELYRRQISGYMVRHKVMPGITGWAQVHGLRGETDTVEKMALRVRYDLEYLRNWSASLDLRILLKTIVVVLRGKNAY